MLRHLLLSSGILAACVALPLAGCEPGPAAKAAAPAQQAPPVSAAAAVSRDVPVYINAIGKIVPIDTVAIIPQVDGKVMAAHVEDGAYVTKGQLLFEIDPRPYEAELASAEAMLAQRNAERNWAQADFKRTQELAASNVASQLEFEQKKSTLGVIDAQILAAKAAIDASTLKLQYCKISSPIDGRAGARLVVPGNIVKENDKPMLVIQQIAPIYAEFTVNENDLGTIRTYMVSHGMPVGHEDSLGLTVKVAVPANSQAITAALGAASTQPADSFVNAREGKLTFLDNSVQAATGTVRLRATVENVGPFFWPGQFVNVQLVLTTKKDAVLIPATAEQIGQQGPYVYVVKQSEIEDPATKTKHPATVAEQRSIEVGQLQGDMRVVTSGVKEGELVITSGHMMVQPGGPVTVINAPAPATAPSGVASR